MASGGLPARQGRLAGFDILRAAKSFGSDAPGKNGKERREIAAIHGLHGGVKALLESSLAKALEDLPWKRQEASQDSPRRHLGFRREGDRAGA